MLAQDGMARARAHMHLFYNYCIPRQLHETAERDHDYSNKRSVNQVISFVFVRFIVIVFALLFLVPIIFSLRNYDKLVKYN